jgi:hypothetical protein
MAVGDSIRIEMKGRDGLSVFGAIEQTVAGPQVLAAPLATDDGAPAEASGPLG